VTEIVSVESAKSKGNEPLLEPGEPHRVAGARTRDARARDDVIVTDSDPDSAETDADDTPDGGLEALVNLWVDEAKATLERLWGWLSRERGLLAEHPAALADLFAYWWRSPMAGDSGAWRFLQRIHGFTFGLFFTFTGYAWAWLGQRPLRSLTFLVLFTIVWRFS
jgi:hypothetical protein